MIKKRLLFLSWLIINVLALPAQNVEEESRSIYDNAEASYDIGRIEEAQQMLINNVKYFSGSIRQSAYRLLSLCALAQDDNASAEAYAKLLLRENPYYSTSLNDPQRFIDMIEQISGRSENTIITASSHEELLSEVPVPTTLITEQMIRDSGARNLQEVLAAYVPGMYIVDCNDDINIAMRGIFSNGQEKILIMLDGHRLNSYCTNISAPDFSIGLEKLHQIEVLRGPSSSLYGGVTLTAVVNLITKKGADVDGVKVRAGYGNHGQLKGDVIFGKRYYDLDLILWGSIYKSSGEKCIAPENENALAAPNREITIGAIGLRPSYEVGLNVRWKDIQFVYDTQFSQVRSPYTIGSSAAPYDYDRYRTYDGLHPGFATNSHHASLKYSTQLGKVAVDGVLTYDNGDLTHYQVINDDTLKWFGDIVGFDESLTKLFNEHGGTSRYINGQEQTYGAQVKGDYNYINTASHNGYLTFGAEYSHFQLDDVRYNIGYDFIYATPENARLAQMGKGNENSYNAFVQLKHQWRSFIVNAGVRYDHKVQFNDSRLNELSPRLALIYVKPKWNVKLSYSKSFVDAPYLYQKMNQFLSLLSETSSDNTEEMVYYHLRPETLHSLQLTFAGTKWLPGLDYEVNLFYNRAKDLIYSDILTQRNGEKDKTIGAELMASYKNKQLTANFNATWINTLKSSIQIKDIDDNNNTPAFMTNLLLAWQVSQPLRLHTKATFYGKQKSYNVSINTLTKIHGILDKMNEAIYEGNERLADELFDESVRLIDEELVTSRNVGSRIVFDLGAEYRLGKATFGIDIHNLLNKQYYQSGMNTGLVPQRGRWILATIGYQF